jgi:hypothetical protein
MKMNAKQKSLLDHVKQTRELLGEDHRVELGRYKTSIQTVKALESRGLIKIIGGRQGFDSNIVTLRLL